MSLQPTGTTQSTVVHETKIRTPIKQSSRIAARHYSINAGTQRFQAHISRL
jgi:hypothetical protein